MKTVIFFSVYFPPQITPRAFRVNELYKEFMRRGYRVVVCLPDGIYCENEIEKRVVDMDFENSMPPSSLGNSYLKKILRKFIPGSLGDIKAAFKMAKYAKKAKGRYDVVISVGLPFSVHLLVALLKSLNVISSDHLIADYGDPFTAQERKNKKCFYAAYIEKLVLRFFDYVVIPTQSAREAYKNLCDAGKIKIIPQALDLSAFSRREYKAHKPIRFAYAGLFYTDIRNPALLFEFLSNFDSDFVFCIFTDINHPDTSRIINKYKPILCNRLEVRAMLPRLECVEELSTFNFLINVENSTNLQSPSKLIDYTIAQRPVFSFSQNNFDADKFKLYCADEIDFVPLVDLKEFDIRNSIDELLRKC